MLGQMRGWEWLIIAALILLLFGAKRLPDAARGLGRSLRIFKAETKGLAGDAAAEETAGTETPTAAPAPTPLPAAPVTPAAPPIAAPAAEAAPPERAEG
jgi:sec-independent protein translocase protein TatA